MRYEKNEKAAHKAIAIAGCVTDVLTVVVLTMQDAREIKADRTNSGLLMYTANMATVHEVVTQ